MAHDAIGETVAPGAHQQRSDDHQADVGEDGESVSERDVHSHAKLAGDLGLAQCPGAERPNRADGDQLPKPAFLQWRESQAITKVRRWYVDAPNIPGRADRRAPNDQGGAEDREERRRYAKKSDKERSYPKIEQVTADQGATPDAVFPFKTEHSHRQLSYRRIVARRMDGRREAVTGKARRMPRPPPRPDTVISQRVAVVPSAPRLHRDADLPAS